MGVRRAELLDALSRAAVAAGGCGSWGPDSAGAGLLRGAPGGGASPASPLPGEGGRRMEGPGVEPRGFGSTLPQAGP